MYLRGQQAQAGLVTAGSTPYYCTTQTQRHQRLSINKVRTHTPTHKCAENHPTHISDLSASATNTFHSRSAIWKFLGRL